MYKLADGSLSTDYKIGDEFEVVGEHHLLEVGDIVTLTGDDNSNCPFFNVNKSIKWYKLKPHRKQFTKADLKDGMVVTYQDGSERWVFGNSLMEFDVTSLEKKATLSAFSDDMSHKLVDMTIVKVAYMGETLWEREEETSEQKEIKRLRSVIEDAQKALSKLEG